MKLRLLYWFAALLLLPFFTSAQIFADRLIDSGPCDPRVILLCPSGVSNPERGVDSDGGNYALMSTDIGLTSQAFYEIGYSIPAPAESIQNIILSEPNQTLSAEVAAALTISFIDENDSTIHQVSAGGLQDVAALSGSGDVYVLSIPMPVGNYKITNVRFDFDGLTSVAASIAVHGAFYTLPESTSIPGCGPEYGTAILRDQNCTNCNFIVDTVDQTFGLLSIPLGQVEAFAEVIIPEAEAGDFIAFEVGPNNLLLGLAPVSNLTLEVLDENDNVIISKSDFELADLILVSGITPNYWIGIQTPNGNYTIASAVLRLTVPLGVMYDLRVYKAIAVGLNNRIDIDGSNPLCFDETMVLTAEPGLQNYRWSSGATGQSIEVSEAGAYICIAEDMDGCTRNGVFFVNDGTFEVDHTTQNPDCGDSNGSISYTYDDVTYPNLSFLWDDGTTGPDRTGLSAGTYTVTITDDTTGCSKTETVALTSNGGPYVSGNVTHSNCPNFTGSIELSVAGASPFTYSWADGPNTKNRSALAPGEYIVTVTDDMQCQTVKSFIVESNADLNISGNMTRPDCGQNIGAINLNVGLGSGSFSYLWSTGASTKNISGLSSGTYSVVVSDNVTGCKDRASFNLNPKGIQNAQLQQIQDESCNGDDGRIEVEEIQGYFITWSTGENTWAIEDLSAGVYTFTYGPEGGECNGTGSYEIEACQEPGFRVNVKNHCIDTENLGNGRIVLEPFNNNENYQVIWSDGQEGMVARDLEEGEYEATITDEFGCISSISATIRSEECDDFCELRFYDVITPNNDGENDFFEIENIEFCADNELRIFNRWGSEVFFAAPYNNDWNGISRIGNSPLPEGAYYYTLTVKSPVRKVYTGMINIKY